MAEQGKIKGFLANAGDAQKIDALTEDIHEALVEYQVCTPTPQFLSFLMLRARLHCNKTFTATVIGSS